MFILLDVGWSCQCTVSSRGLMLHISSCKSAFLAMLCFIVFRGAWFFFIFRFLREIFCIHTIRLPLWRGAFFFPTMHTLVWHPFFSTFSWKYLIETVIWVQLALIMLPCMRLGLIHSQIEQYWDTKIKEGNCQKVHANGSTHL